MKVKRGLLYTASHEWVDFMPDGTARVGISDFVPQKRGKISFLNLCDEGEYYQSGEVIGAFIIGICENLLKGMKLTAFSDAFTFALLIVILVVKPTGLFGEKLTEKV